MQHLQSPDPLRPQISVRELIAMVGCLMALNALSIDILLPALSEIGQALGAPGNDRQLVITSYVFGFGLAQLGFGPLSDALGRRKTLLIALVAYLVATLLCLISQGLWALVAARALQGVAAAATRVIAVAIVRDLVSGRRMAEIMSFAMTVFTVAPILAPSIGQLILFGGDWRVIFIFLFDHIMDRFQASLLIVVPGCVMITQASFITPQLFGYSVTGGIKCGINLIC